MRSITRCIFCYRSDLSREHVWSEWCHPFVRQKSGPRAFIQRKMIQTAPYHARKETIYRERQTDIIQFKLKVVCKTHCNNGWMSRLETRAKPILLPLFTGNPILLDRYNQEILATWIAMKLMVCEFSDPDDLVMPNSERTLLMGRRRPPDIMSIWIGFYDKTNWANTYLRQAATLGFAPIYSFNPQPPSGSYAKNTQVQTLLIGKLFIHATTTTVPGVQAHTPPAISNFMKQIWPYRTNYGWPPLALSDAHIAFVTSSFDRFTRHLPFSAGPSRK